jgi:hypothetical protein
MRYFLLLILLIPAFCIAQDTIHRKLIFLFNAGVNNPENEYGLPPDDIYNSYSKSEAYGFALGGVRFEATAIFQGSTNFGVAVRVGTDMNTTCLNFPQTGISKNKVNQYMGGYYFTFTPKEANYNVYLLALAGEVTANIPNEENSYYQENGIGGFVAENEVPGFGTGLGFYGGAGLSCPVINKWLYFDMSAGYLYSCIDFPNGAITTYTSNLYPASYIVSTSYQKMGMVMGVLQGNVGISSRL